ncbi:MAG: tetratricopeptide repeat protein [Bacteroidales bacterium]|nr:tetratricopeptide repeat protein [Bacteroidales bacterium]
MIVAVASFGYAGYAQTLEEAVAARNKGAELMAGGNIESAIAELEKCVKISQQVGAEADEHKDVAELALPGLYLQKANKLVVSKDYEAAVTALEETIAVATKYRNEDIKGKAEKPLTDVYFGIGLTAFNKKDLPTAIKNLDIVNSRDADYAKAYYVKGAVYQQQQDEAKMVENFKLAIEKAEATNDKSTEKNAKSALSKYFFNKGILALQKKTYDAAITAFNQVIEVDDTYADAYFRLASCYNAKKNYDKAIENAKKALSIKTTDNDGIYFELGNAHLAKKENDKACEAFKNVKAEPYAANAKHQREVVLKCK